MPFYPSKYLCTEKTQSRWNWVKMWWTPLNIDSKSAFFLSLSSVIVARILSSYFLIQMLNTFEADPSFPPPPPPLEVPKIPVPPPAPPLPWSSHATLPPPPPPPLPSSTSFLNSTCEYDNSLPHVLMRIYYWRFIGDLNLFFASWG